MDRSSSAGNPSAASSRSLPAHTLPAEEDQQTRESVSLCGTQNHQRPREIQSYSVEKDQSPRQIQRTEDEAEQPVLTINTKHSDPLTEKLKPAPRLNKSFATKLDAPKPDQKKSEHEQQLDHSLEDQTQSCPCFTNQRAEEDPPHTSTKDLTVQRRQDHQDPPPHLTSPPPADQQNLLPAPPASAIHLSTRAPPAPPLTIEAFCDQVWPCPPGSSSSDTKLCGFLQKQGGPLKAWKQRWFTYEEKKNQLFYYRTPQDVTPLGRVELNGATFTYPLRAERGTFHIRTPERTFILKVH